MNQSVERLQTLLAAAGLTERCPLTIRTNPSGLPSAWVTLTSRADLPRFAEGLRDIGGRLATMTVYRPDPHHSPKLHEIAYHLLLDGLPITAQVTLQGGEALPSVTPVFLNADWEEREMMELSAIVIDGHPNPRRLFLDESIEVGVFDRYVPYSEMTNVADHGAVWERIKQESCEAQKRRQERDDLAAVATARITA